jgi:hypothetical protein
MATLTLRTDFRGIGVRVTTIELPHGSDAALVRDTCLVARDAWLTELPEYRLRALDMLQKLGLQDFQETICDERTIIVEDPYQ